jgi:hypothetical protein
LEKSFSIQNKNLENAYSFIFLILAVGYITGTVTHIVHFQSVIKTGFLQFAELHKISPVVNGYWLLLTLIDPAIAFLLIKKSKLGILLGFLNILINVTVNCSVVINKLETVTIMSIYHALGNIFNSLQIALFLFSLFTLPLFYLEKAKIVENKILYLKFYKIIPQLVLIIGIVIHTYGICKIVQGQILSSLWSLWVDFSMLVINSVLLYTLLKKYRIGYFGGIMIFTVFALLQGGFAVAIYIGVNTYFNLIMALTITVCCLAISSLLLQFNISVKQYLHYFK